MSDAAGAHPERGRGPRLSPPSPIRESATAWRADCPNRGVGPFIALISPPGRGALAVLHLCGPGSRPLAEELLEKPISSAPVHGRLAVQGEVLDEVMARTTEGFTGEETVEITCHGGPVPVERVTAALAARGAERISPEGLLERGFTLGHLDQLQVEAHVALTRAATELAALVLFDQAEGALSRAIREMKSKNDARRLLATSALGLALSSPRRVVLAGSPNAGKSTLFNALCGRERAIVSPAPGTTRDPVCEVIAIDQVPVELVDTAGLGESKDFLEQLAVDRTRTALQAADAVLFLFDAAAGVREEELRFLDALEHPRMIWLLNKADLGAKSMKDVLPVSALTGQGLDGVRHAILEVLGIVPRHEPGAPVVFTERQWRLIKDVSMCRIDIDATREELLRGRPGPSPTFPLPSPRSAGRLPARPPRSCRR